MVDVWKCPNCKLHHMHNCTDHLNHKCNNCGKCFNEDTIIKKIIPYRVFKQHLKDWNEEQDELEEEMEEAN